MKKLPIYRIVVLSLVMSAFTIDAAEVKKVSAIEFRGLENVSKYEIIKKVRSKAVKDGIIIDIGSFRDVLSANPIIDDFDINEEGTRLVVTVSEKKPAMVVIYRKGNKMVPCELDKDNRIISHTIHSSAVPLIYMREDYNAGVEISARTKSMVDFMKKVRFKYPSLYREISEIYVNQDILKIYLRGRKTGFVVKPVSNQFLKLTYIAGYLDRAGYYPTLINITDARPVIRK